MCKITCLVVKSLLSRLAFKLAVFFSSIARQRKCHRLQPPSPPPCSFFSCAIYLVTHISHLQNIIRVECDRCVYVYAMRQTVSQQCYECLKLQLVNKLVVGESSSAPHPHCSTMTHQLYMLCADVWFGSAKPKSLSCHFQLEALSTKTGVLRPILITFLFFCFSLSINQFYLKVQNHHAA